MAGGRKLAFDKQEALYCAMKTFWSKGFSAASLSDLTQSMGINKPSMYSTFGSKEDLFIQASEHYIEHIAKPHLVHLEQPNVDLKTRLSNYLHAILSVQCDPELPKGCYVVLCMAELAAGDLPDKAHQLLTEAADFLPNLLESLFKTDPESIAKGLDKNAKINALTLVTLMHGTASLSRTRNSQQDLSPVIDKTLLGLGL